MSHPFSPHKTCRVDFKPSGKSIESNEKTTLLTAARQAGLAVSSSCGGTGRCGQCRVIVLSGHVSPPSIAEKDILTEQELERGERLACQIYIGGDVTVHVPETSMITEQRIQLESDVTNVRRDPPVSAFTIDIPPPTLDDPRSDIERIAACLPHIKNATISADRSVMRQISSAAREWKWQITVLLRGSEIIGVIPPGTTYAGLAVDLGTTTIAASLVDLTKGEQLGLAGALNPQISYGEDIISRLTYAHRTDEGGHTLAVIVQKTVNDLLNKLIIKAGLEYFRVSEVCLVGNPAMIHLFIELPVRQLVSSPYVGATSDSIDIKARDVGMVIAPGAYIHILPAIRGFVGADHVAMIMASNLDQTDHIALGIDIGTNTEIVLAGKGNGFLTTTSCASGPAFEGAHIRDGMRATAGAIESVIIHPKKISMTTIDNAPATGLCGSGIIDATAGLYRLHIINERGRFHRHNHRVRQGNQGPEFVLVPASESGNKRDVVITQHDINQIQLAKGAIRAGLDILLESTNTSPDEVKEVIIAGAFGTYLNIQNARSIGLLPFFPRARYRQTGNASLAGARQALVSKQMRVRAGNIMRRTRYLELTTYPGFKRHYANGMLFP